jgi:nicotinamidase/pyrazinamidase
MRDGEVLLVIDVQNDFCPGGRLAVPKGNDVVPVINRLAAEFRHVVLTQDWHPQGHQSFASSHAGKAPFSEIQMPYGAQTLWPDHCILETDGAAFHKGLNIPHAELILRKGFRKEIDSYSAFFENDRKTPTGLLGYLRERGFNRVTCVGLAFEYCVRYSAEDAATHGFDTIVVEEACRAIDLGGTAAQTRASFRDRGIKVT